MPRTALRAGRRVVIANSRGPESLASVISELGDGVSAQIHHPLTGLNLIQL
jgi:hypothetical protein